MTTRMMTFPAPRAQGNEPPGQAGEALRRVRRQPPPPRAADRPALPKRSTRHERDGRRPEPQPARPHPGNHTAGPDDPARIPPRPLRPAGPGRCATRPGDRDG